MWSEGINSHTIFMSIKHAKGKNLSSQQPKYADTNIGDMPLPPGLVLLLPGPPSTQPLDDNEPTSVRQTELRTASQQNRMQGRPPYADILIQTRGELIWIIQENGWIDDPDSLEKQKAADLRNVNLSSADLSNVPLQYANLKDATFVSTNLSGANLSGANIQNGVFLFSNLSGAQLQGAMANHAQFHQACLQGTHLSAADMSYADLSETDLQYAILQFVNFRHASLYLAKLDGANLKWVDLCGATLDGSRMNNETILADIKIDSKTQLGDIYWNGASLTHINWKQITYIGDELFAKTKFKDSVSKENKERKSAEERTHEYQQASRTYRSLALALREQGLSRKAIHFNARAECMDCYALFHIAHTYHS